MKFLTIATTALGLLAAPMAASADTKDCPPGLAKKSPPCVAPGQAKKHLDRVEDRRDARRDEIRKDAHVRHHRMWRSGEIFDGEYERFDDFDRIGWGRPGDGISYWRVGDQVLRVNTETREILDVTELADRRD